MHALRHPSMGCAKPQSAYDRLVHHAPGKMSEIAHKYEGETVDARERTRCRMLEALRRKINGELADKTKQIWFTEAQRQQLEQPAAAAAAGGAPARAPRRGRMDVGGQRWACSACAFENYGFRTTCLKGCGTTNGGKGAAAGGGGKGGGGKGKWPKPAPAPARAPAEDKPPPQLVPAHWNVPVRTVGELTPGGEGVALATVAEATAALAQVGGDRGGRIALLVPQALEGHPDDKVLTVLTMRGQRAERTRRFLHQVGDGGVAMQMTTARTFTTRGNTAEVVVEIDEVHAASKLVEEANATPGATLKAVRAWLKEHGGDDAVLEAWRPRGGGPGCGIRGRRVLSAVARVRTDRFEALMKASGADGVFLRKVWRAEGERDRHRVIWLPGNNTLAEARERLPRHPHHWGLARNGRGLGIRATPERYEEMLQGVLGAAEAEKKKRVMYEVAGVPLDVAADALVQTLAEWGWDADTIRHYVPPRRFGGGRTWIVAAMHPPPGGHGNALLTIDGADVTVQTAPDRPREARRGGPATAAGFPGLSGLAGTDAAHAAAAWGGGDAWGESPPPPAAAAAALPALAGAWTRGPPGAGGRAGRAAEAAAAAGNGNDADGDALMAEQRKRLRETPIEDLNFEEVCAAIDDTRGGGDSRAEMRQARVAAWADAD